MNIEKMLDDEPHKAIRAKIVTLEEKINSLEAHKEDFNLQHQALHKLTVASKEHPELNEAVEQQKLRANSTPTPQDIDTQIDVLRKQIDEEWKIYFTSEVILSPISLETVKSYENKNGTVIRQLADGGHKLFLFLSSNYPVENTKIVLNPDGSPNTILRYVQSSDTRGYVMKFIQAILLDQPQEPEKTKSTPSKPLFPDGIKMRECPRCHITMYWELKQCGNCFMLLDDDMLPKGTKPKENLAKLDKPSKICQDGNRETKGLIAKIRERF